MKIDTRHPEYTSFLPKWEKVRDCAAGQDEVKKKRTAYLPMLGGQEEAEYKNYLFRAIYVDFTGRANEVAIGQIFRKPPAVGDIPQEILDNVDLKGTSFNYFWREVNSEVDLVNRCGILVDYQEDQKRTYSTMYKAESIINWKTEIIDGIEKLSLVVLEGVVPSEIQDDFTHETEKRWKVLSLEDGVYTVSEYKQMKHSHHVENFVKINSTQPIKNNNVLTFIPFYFVTAHGITWKLKNAPLLPMSNINLGHFRNGADYENLLHFTGVPTIISKGRKDDTVPFPVGSAVDFTKDGGADYMQASSDSGLSKALQEKVEMMAVLSSSLLSSAGRYVASAQTATVTTEGERATLSDISNSMTVSANQIMSFMMEWEEDKDGYQTEIKFNTDFQTAKIDPQLLTSLMGALGSGTMSFETFYFNLKVAEMYPEKWTLEDEQKAIANYEKGQADKEESDFEKSLKAKQD